MGALKREKKKKKKKCMTLPLVINKINIYINYTNVNYSQFSRWICE